MPKLNNKGFAIASILYSIMVLFLLLLLSILGILGNRKAILDKNKKDILEEINSEILYNKINFEHKNITIINRGNLDDIRYALLDGVTAVDESGNNIDIGKINYNLDLNNIENKSYNVTYTVDRGNKIITSTRQITFVSDSSNYINNFDYTGNSQTFTSNYDGNYRVELWGAQGGSYSDIFQGATGGYTDGKINLVKDNILYFYVGGQGGSDATLKQNEGGYNGGGLSGYHSNAYSFGGGGATDVRLISGDSSDFSSLKSRIMVASGGGGIVYHTTYSHISGYGGGLVGGTGSGTHNNQFSYGGTQISGGEGYNSQLSQKGLFGQGGQGVLNSGGWGGGGGSGYYGGALGFGQGGGGGSSFISGYDGCDAIAENSTENNIIHTGQSVHYSGYKFENAAMYAGNEEMPTHDGSSTMIGNSGNGYAKISLIYYY